MNKNILLVMLLIIGAASLFAVALPTPSLTHVSNTTRNIDVWMTSGSTDMVVGETYNFYDSGGPNNPYNSMEYYMYTFNPPAGYCAKVTFLSWDNGNDDMAMLTIRNGVPGTTLYDSSVDGSPSNHTYKSPTGPLLIWFSTEWFSDPNPGWSALVELESMAPSPATPVFPANSATGIYTNSTLSWTNATGYAPTDYNVYFGTSNPPAYIGNQTDSTYLPIMLPNTTYYWKIVPHNNAGNAVECPVWSFTTGAPQIYIGLGSTTLQVGESYAFFDSGGPYAPYSAGEMSEYAFYPPAGYHVKVTFDAFDIDPAHGFTVLEPIFPYGNELYNSGWGGIPTSYTSSLGALEFRFNSDWYNELRAGWTARIELISAYDVTPTVTTEAVSAITTTTATANGNVTSLGNPNPTQYGHCWALTGSPTTSSSKTSLGAKNAIGAYTSSLTGLSVGTLYYVRAYATNTSGTVYGDQVTFTTLPYAPATPTASAATAVTASGFTANWSAASGATGYRLDVSTVNTFASFVTGYNDLALGNVTTSAVTGLSGGTTYYYRVRAVNAGGTSSNSSYQTVLTLPGTATYSSPANAATGVSLTPSLTWTAPTGTITGYKVYFGTDTPPSNIVNGTTQTAMTYAPAALSYNTTYYWKIVPYNATGDASGASIYSFTTLTLAPVVTTQAASVILCTTATANGNITTLGNPTPTQYGHCWTTTGTPTISNSKTTLGAASAIGAYTSSLTGLASGTLHYVRAYATNSEGTSYGSTVSFTTIPAPPATVTLTITGTTTATITWTASIGARYYYVGIVPVGQNVNWNQPYWSSGALSRSVTGLNPNTNYVACVCALNTGWAYYGQTTSTNNFTLPNPAITPSPANAATGVSLIPSLSWTAPTGGADSGYKIYLGTDNPPTNIVNGTTQTATTYIPAALSANTTYYWKAVSYNSSGVTPSPTIWSFVTSPLASGAPTMNAPTGYSTTGFTLNWSASSGATGYRIDVSTVESFASFVGTYNNLDVGNVTSSAVTGLSPGTLYYYRVRSYNSGGTSASSNVGNNETIPAAPVAAVAGSISVSGFRANWASTTGAVWYYLDISTNSSFTALVSGYDNKDMGTALYCDATGLNSGTTYYYRVRAYGNNGTSANSNVITAVTTQTFNVTIDTGAITGVSVYINDVLYATNPVNPLVFDAGFSGTFRVVKTDYFWNLPDGTGSNVITSLSADAHINFIGTYTYDDPDNSGFVYIGEPDIPITALASTLGAIVTQGVQPPPLPLVNPIVVVFTGSTPSDVTISVPAGTWYVIAYYENAWQHANPYPANGPGEVVFANVPFSAKSDIPVIVTGTDATLPVELSSFTAVLTAQNYVNLTWTTQSETDLSGYYIYRSTTAVLADVELISALIPATNTSSEQIYVYQDAEVEGNVTYNYWLQATELNSTGSFHGPVSVIIGDGGEIVPPPAVDSQTCIAKVYPNPFNPQTQIAYNLKTPTSVIMVVYNHKGQLIRTLVNADKISGYHRINWDGRDSKGVACSSGVYYVKMQAGNVTSTRKMVLMK